MSFFVPYAQDREGAQLLWDHGREQLEARGLPTTWRRIRALLFEHGGVTHLIAAVGSDTEVEEDDPVMLILEASNEDASSMSTPSPSSSRTGSPLGSTWTKAGG